MTLSDHFTRHPKTHRATELDPDTFGKTPEWVREPYNPWGMRFVVLWCLGCIALFIWWVL